MISIIIVIPETILIMNYYKPQKGTIRIDGNNVEEISIEFLRKKIAFIPQDTFLLSASVQDNISLERPEASFEEVEQAAIWAKCDEFVEDLLYKYETVIEEMVQICREVSGKDCPLQGQCLQSLIFL